MWTSNYVHDLCQLRLRWLGHVRRIKDEIIPKHILYGMLTAGKRNLGRPRLRYRKVRKWDMDEPNIDLNKWEELVYGPLQLEKLLAHRF